MSGPYKKSTEERMSGPYKKVRGNKCPVPTKKYGETNSRSLQKAFGANVRHRQKARGNESPMERSAVFRRYYRCDTSMTFLVILL